MRCTGSSRAVHGRSGRAVEASGDCDVLLLVDITPEALITRLRQGRVHPRARVGTAPENLFRIESVQAQRLHADRGANGSPAR